MPVYTCKCGGTIPYADGKCIRCGRKLYGGRKVNEEYEFWPWKRKCNVCGVIYTYFEPWDLLMICQDVEFVKEDNNLFKHCMEGTGDLASKLLVIRHLTNKNKELLMNEYLNQEPARLLQKKDLYQIKKQMKYCYAVAQQINLFHNTEVVTIENVWSIKWPDGSTRPLIDTTVSQLHSINVKCSNSDFWFNSKICYKCFNSAALIKLWRFLIRRII